MKIGIKSVYIILPLQIITILLPLNAMAIENLDEMMARKPRKGTNAFYHGASTTNNYIRQPQSLSYTDMTTGHEVWVLTSTNNKPSIYHGELSNSSVWSADGKRLGFFSSMSPVGFTPSSGSFMGGNMIGYIVNSDGAGIRELMGAAARSHISSTFRFFNWNPSQPDIYYVFGESGSGLSLDYRSLYQNTVTDISISYKKLVTTPVIGRIYKTINSTGTHVVAQNYADKEKYFPIKVWPPEEAKLLDSDGWSWNRGMMDDFGGANNTEWHDLYFPDPDGKYFIHLKGTPGQIWKYDLVGSDSDGGPKYLGDSLNWNTREAEVIWVANPTLPSYQPKADWFGHPAFDMWGTMIAGGQSDNVGGNSAGSDAVWNYRLRQYVVGNGNISYAAHNFGRNYTNWTSWSDYVSTGTHTGLIAVFKYNKKEADGDFWQVADHHGVQNGSTSYELTNLPRQCQSPDGTKIAYEVQFLGGATQTVDIAYAVAYFPYPPEITNASITSDSVTIRFDWQNTLSDPNPRTYTKRGWPDEATDDRPIPRETNKFRLWRSSDNSTWTPVRTVDAEPFTRFDFVNGGFKTGQKSYWEISDTPGDGTWYYAVTSVEHSGLESRSLSNSWMVVISGGEIINGSGSGIQAGAYPSDPGGKTNFYTTLPPAPDNLTISNGAAPGHYKLTWTEPPKKYTNIRYYNIYYSTTGTPPVDQRYRIASISAGRGITTWTDWLADQSKTPYYRITSVDTQGNEGFEIAPKAPFLRIVSASERDMR